MWTIFKVFIEFVTILLLFYVSVFWPRGTWDLSSLTGDGTRIPCIGRQSLNHWTASEVPESFTFNKARITPFPSGFRHQLGSAQNRPLFRICYFVHCGFFCVNFGILKCCIRILFISITEGFGGGALTYILYIKRLPHSHHPNPSLAKED